MPTPAAPGSRHQWIGSAVLMLMLGLVAIARFSSRYGWSFYLELLSHFQVQYAAFVWLLWGGLYLLRCQKLILWGLFLCAVVTLPLLSSYIPPTFLSPSPNADLRIFSANLHVKNHGYAKVLAQIQAEAPDVVVAIEVDDAWVEQLDSLGFPYRTGRPNPYSVGLMVYSRYPLTNASIQKFGIDQNIAVVGDLVISNKTIALVAAHPPPPFRRSYFHSRNRQLDSIGQYLKSHSTPVVLVGDLNVTPWSPYYQRLQQQATLQDARQGFGVTPTWKPMGSVLSSALAPLFAIPIDHCLVSPSLNVTQFRVGAATGSDHRPVITDISLDPG